MVLFKQSEDPFKKKKCQGVERRAVQKKEYYEKTLEEKEHELKLKMHKNRALYENKIKKIQQIIERL